MNGGNVMRRVISFGSIVYSRKLLRPADRRTGSLPPGKKLVVAERVAEGPKLAVGPAGPVKIVPLQASSRAASQLPVAGGEKAGRILGIIACTCVGLWWANSLLLFISSTVLKLPESLWSRVWLPLFFVALFGSHFAAFISVSFIRSKDPWSARAAIAFWASMLIWIPLGTLIRMIQDLWV
jgi:hypothetical protein